MRDRSRSNDDDYDDDERPRRRYDRPQRSSFGTAFGLSTGCLLGVLTVLVGIPLLVCGGCLLIGSKVSQNMNQAIQEKEKEEAIERTGKMGEEIRFGSSLGVTLERVGVEKVSATSPSGRELTSSDLLFVAHLRFKNYDPNSLVKVKGQSNETLIDDHGNKYKTMSITTEVGIPAKISGQIGSGHYIELRSDESHGDVVVFERPLPGANTLTLTLDADSYGGKGKLKYILPKSSWTGK